MSRRDFTNEIGEAQYLADRLVASHAGYGRQTAIQAAARAVGISKWTFWAILYGRRKSIGSDTINAIRREYLKLCERQLSHLKAEIEQLQERCGDDSMVDLGDATARLVERLRQARSRQG